MDTRKPIDEKAQERYDVLFRLVTVWRIADRVVRLETMDDGLEIRNALKSAMGLPTPTEPAMPHDVHVRFLGEIIGWYQDRIGELPDLQTIAEQKALHAQAAEYLETPVSDLFHGNSEIDDATECRNRVVAVILRGRECDLQHCDDCDAHNLPDEQICWSCGYKFPAWYRADNAARAESDAEARVGKAEYMGEDR